MESLPFFEFLQNSSAVFLQSAFIVVRFFNVLQLLLLLSLSLWSVRLFFTMQLMMMMMV